MCCLDMPLLSGFSSAWWLSIGLGSGIGLLYAIASLLVNRYAMRQPGHRFLLVFMGGMMVRLALALVGVTLILLLLPVQQRAFVASFLGVFVIGLIVEIVRVHRRLLVEK